MQPKILNASVEFRKNHRSMYYKTSFKEKEHTSCNFLMQKSDVKVFPNALSQEKGIPLKMKKAILSLLAVVPRRNRLFWEQMNENEDLMI